MDKRQLWRLLFGCSMGVLPGLAGCCPHGVGKAPGWAALLPGEVAFVREGKRDFQVCTVRPDGSAERCFGPFPQGIASYGYPRFNGDRSRIFFSQASDVAGPLDRPGVQLYTARWSMDRQGADQRLEQPWTTVAGWASHAPDIQDHPGVRRILSCFWVPSRKWPAATGSSELQWGPEKQTVLFQRVDAIGRAFVVLGQVETGEWFYLTRGIQPSWSW